jgi:hypothetical protein
VVFLAEYLGLKTELGTMGFEQEGREETEAWTMAE